MALAVVASVLARNAVTDNKALISGLKAQYEMGVDAGQMAKDAKYAEAMADITNGIGQILSGACGMAMCVGMGAAGSASVKSPHKDAADATEGKMNDYCVENSPTEEKMQADVEERNKLQDEINGEGISPEEKEVKQNQLSEKNKEIDTSQLRIDYAKADKKGKAELEDQLAQSDTKFADLKQERDKHQVAHDQYVAGELQNNRQIMQMFGQALTSIIGGSAQILAAPFKMIQGNYEMWQQIFQTASQVFGSFVTALTNDMQSQQQMVDSVVQMEQKAQDSYQQATATHA